MFHSKNLYKIKGFFRLPKAVGKFDNLFESYLILKAAKKLSWISLLHDVMFSSVVICTYFIFIINNTEGSLIINRNRYFITRPRNRRFPIECDILQNSSFVIYARLRYSFANVRLIDFSIICKNKIKSMLRFYLILFHLMLFWYFLIPIVRSMYYRLIYEEIKETFIYHFFM